MKKFNPVITRDLFGQEAGVIEQTRVAVVDLSVRGGAPKHSRNCFGQLAQISFVLSQLLFGLPAILDVRVRSVPSDNGPDFASKGLNLEQEPVIRAIEAAHPCLGFARSSRGQYVLPFLDEHGEIVRMDCGGPFPADGLIHGHACKMQPSIVEILCEAISIAPPKEKRNRVERLHLSIAVVHQEVAFLPVHL
jgi:hypothetical protein